MNDVYALGIKVNLFQVVHLKFGPVKSLLNFSFPNRIWQDIERRKDCLSGNGPKSLVLTTLWQHWFRVITRCCGQFVYKSLPLHRGSILSHCSQTDIHSFLAPDVYIYIFLSFRQFSCRVMRRIIVTFYLGLCSKQYCKWI